VDDFSTVIWKNVVKRLVKHMHESHLDEFGNQKNAFPRVERAEI